jgi:ABC-type multidrug transport system fused ATPase/permease subunit
MPTDGSIEYDGVDLRELDLREFRGRLGFVLQEPFLFDATIAENIAFGHEQIDLARAGAAAAIANAADFIERLPLGYQTRVGDSGLKLSTGQAQRVSIARAVYDQPSVLLLDEPTSALDPEAERAVKEGVERLLHGRTAFVVAHRLSTIRDADLICVLEQGRLIEQGTHDELVGSRDRSKMGSRGRQHRQLSRCRPLRAAATLAETQDRSSHLGGSHDRATRHAPRRGDRTGAG